MFGHALDNKPWSCCWPKSKMTKTTTNQIIVPTTTNDNDGKVDDAAGKVNAVPFSGAIRQWRQLGYKTI